MQEAGFVPEDLCADDTSCAGATVFAVFLNRTKTETEARYSMLQTTFIVFLLGAGAMSFSKDTQTLVIAPIEKMVNIVKQLADDPLTKPDVDEHEPEVYQAKSKAFETSMLENTILKIGGLLQVGFGEAGILYCSIILQYIVVFINSIMYCWGYYVLLGELFKYHFFHGVEL